VTDPSMVPAVGFYNQADACTLSGGEWSSTAPLTNLQTRSLRSLARSADGLSSLQPIAWFKGSSFEAPARFIGLLNDNLVGTPLNHAPSALLWRVRTIYRPTIAATFNPRSRPVSVLTAVNLTGSVSTVQTFDNTWMSATVTNANTTARFSMDGATCPMKTGAGLQVVSAFVRRTAGANLPTARIEILEGGTTRVVGPNTEIWATTGQLLTLAWDAATFSSPDSNAVQVQIVGTASSTCTVEPGCVQWAAEYESGSGATVRDSGWLERTLPAGYWGPPRSIDSLYLVHDFGENYPLDELCVEVNFYDSSDQYFEAGRLVVSEAHTFLDPTEQPAEAAANWSLRRVDPSIKKRMWSGGVRSSRRRTYQELRVDFPHLSSSSTFDTVLGLIDSGGVTREMLWMLQPGVYVWGTQKELGENTHQPTFPVSFSRTFLIEETV
jgi:hypothetical protein